MNNESGDELRVLRGRAYGPHADIHEDVAALRRLRELEAGTSARPASPPEQDAPQEEDALAGSTGQDDVQAEAQSEASQGDSTGVTSPWRLRLWWGISIAGVIIVTFLIASLVIPQFEVRPPFEGAEPVARLLESPLGNPAAAVLLAGVDGAQGYEELDGLIFMTAVSPLYSGATNDECLWVAYAQDFADATANSYSGQVFSGCAAGAFPASVAVKVAPDMPEDLVERFPVGTALQFVYDDSTSSVVVFAATE